MCLVPNTCRLLLLYLVDIMHFSRTEIGVHYVVKSKFLFYTTYPHCSIFRVTTLEITNDIKQLLATNSLLRMRRVKLTGKEREEDFFFSHWGFRVVR